MIFLIIIFSIFLFFLLIFFFSYLLSYKKLKHIKNTEASTLQIYKESSFFKKIFVELPYCIIRDKLKKNPNEFPLYGLHILVGPMGCGKTSSLCYLIKKYKTIYPQLLVKCNFDCTLSDERLTDFHQMCTDANGIYGELDVIAEIQTWFDCSISKKFPPEMLASVSQQRHVRRCIIGDTQVFNRCAIQLRQQCTQLIECHCLFGCLNIDFCYTPVLDDEGHIITKKLNKVLCFLQTDDLRKMYDSYANIDFGLSSSDA